MYYANGDVVTSFDPMISYDHIVKGVAHRGLSAVAPENTLPAYVAAKKAGFFFVETDVQLTSDGVPVCLHDGSINRTSNGTGYIENLTWEQVQAYDFGSWKGAKYAGTKIPSFEQFIRLCRDLGLHPYIEIKSNATFTEAQVQGLVDIVAAHGLARNCTWISFSTIYLGYVKAYDASARLGYLCSGLTSSDISKAEALVTSDNEVIVDTSATSSEAVALCKAAGLPMEVWDVEATKAGIVGYDPYITGVTHNELIAGKVLFDNAIND